MKLVDPQASYCAYREEIDDAIAGVLGSGRFILGPTVEEFEQQLADYLGVAHVIGVGNGTESLQLALMALGIGPGDEVITVPFTFVASATPISLVGATPVFVDIDPNTYCMDVSQIEAAIGPRTRAIMPVSLFGQMADMDAIEGIAAKHGLAVVEDAAQSIGASRGGRRSGSTGTLASTSFYPSKPLACFGDGGALMTDDTDLAGRLRKLRQHGSEQRDDYRLLGMNSRLDALQAAILSVRLAHLDDELSARRAVASRFSTELAGSCDVPAVEGESSWACYTIRSANRDQLQQSLSASGIPSIVYYSRCCHEQPIFADLGYGPGSFPVAECATQEVLSLPIHPWLTVGDQQAVIAGVQAALLAPTG